MQIPSLLLKKLYNFGSLKNKENGVQFSIKNRFPDATFTELISLKIDDGSVSLDDISLDLNGGGQLSPSQITPENPLTFSSQMTVGILMKTPALSKGKHKIEIAFGTTEFGELNFDVTDAIRESYERPNRIPRDSKDNYSNEVIKARQDFIHEFTGKKLEHIPHYSFDAHDVEGNCENFTGVAQIPIGFAGPIKMNGEHAQGDFLVPLATAEGTLVASYNRGIKVLNLCGGVKCTVVVDVMQRAPVFVFSDAREGREFVKWVKENTDKITEEAEATSSIAKLKYIDSYMSNKFVYLRFNYSTGDAAGQNMVGRATFAACSWILDNYKGIEHFYLESNFATDKKASQINIMRTRGKRVTAEAYLKRDVLVQHMRVEPESLHYHSSISNLGAFISGANNNGAHSANGITAMFVATGQDVANVSESSAGILYTEMMPNRDLYISLTIPSLIVATYGGGTGLATQRESLELLGCYGKGKVYKLAEIIAGVALAGEVSLGSAISSSDWVSSHEQYGRNR
ncbi:MAG: hydroxymethylglutaryl-CoA reductase [Anaerolineaceae bacterium 4572_78]|nr:MAG: hydroxymethylglutaryl-CoA reductase [Anaerolineaceae bacterium 4572_78]